jgi:glycosyltransferase involved in cell wall biosynthesis
MTKLALLCAEPRGRVDAIYAATQCLDAALNDLGLDSHVVTRDAGGAWTTGATRWHGLVDVARDFNILILQYNPFLYGRRGFAPWLVRDLFRVRARRRHPTLVLYAHETSMPMDGWRKTLMGLWQRAQLRAVHAAADISFATVEKWTAQLAKAVPRRRAVHMPVGSTLPDMRRARDTTRASLGATQRLVVTTLSSGHESHLVSYVVDAVTRIADLVPGVLVLTLGAGAHAVNVRGVEVKRPGEIPAAELAALVAASDLFLAPLVDGISTRRTSMMAALQHGVAVLGTDGLLTDTMLKTSGSLLLCRTGDRHGFVESAAALAVDEPRRTMLAASGRALYARAFDWPRIACDVSEALMHTCE